MDTYSTRKEVMEAIKLYWESVKPTQIELNLNFNEIDV